MAEILVKAVSQHVPEDDARDRMRYKQGHPVYIGEDGHSWGSMETLPQFVVIKIPTVPKVKFRKYVDLHRNSDGSNHARRIWRLQWEKLPLPAQDKLKTVGELTVKASSAYTGEFDYTWTDLKKFFRNDKTGLGETEDL